MNGNEIKAIILYGILHIVHKYLCIPISLYSTNRTDDIFQNENGVKILWVNGMLKQARPINEIHREKSMCMNLNLNFYSLSTLVIIVPHWQYCRNILTTAPFIYYITVFRNIRKCVFTRHTHYFMRNDAYVWIHLNLVGIDIGFCR